MIHEFGAASWLGAFLDPPDRSAVADFPGAMMAHRSLPGVSRAGIISYRS